MKANNSMIQAYQQRCFREYRASIGLPDPYTYLRGNPINVLVPIETAQEGVMIVGAYPSAKFFTVDGISDTPMMDNDSPFSNESYFDGSRVRTIPSGYELAEHYLQPLGIPRELCWITDLVKVFLFKEGHVDRYRKLGVKVAENRSQYAGYAQKSLPWLAEEVRLARPCAAILLGLEVVSILFGISEDAAKRLLDGRCRSQVINGTELNVICLPHPGIIMKRSATNPWPERFEREIRPTAFEELRKLGL
jgi:uracil-DNA glycosylase